MRICLVGGTFDPPHWGHVLLAEALRTALDIQQIVFVPANIPPHKSDENITDAEHRVRMLERVCAHDPYFQIDTREINRKGPSYSIDTIREVKAEFQLDRNEVGFFIGSDNFVDLSSWKESDQLVRLCRILVANRPGFAVSDDLSYYDDVEFIQMPLIELSSSQVRERVNQGRSIRFFVLPGVEQYIRENKLYL